MLSTNAGDITVFIPSNLALTVQATNETGGAGRIISDFAQVRAQTGAQPGVGPVVAEGALNGGGPSAARERHGRHHLSCAVRNRFWLMDRGDVMKAYVIKYAVLGMALFAAAAVAQDQDLFRGCRRSSVAR